MTFIKTTRTPATVKNDKTPALDPGPEEKRRALLESTPAVRIRGHLYFLDVNVTFLSRRRKTSLQALSLLSAYNALCSVHISCDHAKFFF